MAVPHTPPHPVRAWSWQWPQVLAVLAGLFLALYWRVLRFAFFSDDYLFLDRTRSARFAELWSLRDPPFSWYRPWSRELHYWTIQQWFGAHEAPFHIASLALWIAASALYFALVRRLAGTAAAAIATGGVAVLAAWGVLVAWPAGAQDLWFLVWAMVFLHAVTSAKGLGWSIVPFALALLSKETAVVLPAIAFLWHRGAARRSWRESAARVAPLVLVVLVWLSVHPMARRMFAGAHAPRPQPIWKVALRTVLMPLNLDHALAPAHGWMWVAAIALPAIACVVALVALGRSWRAIPAMQDVAASGEKPPALSIRDVVWFALGWAVLSWAPSLVSIGRWAPYYALPGAFGAWVVIGVLLRRCPARAASGLAILTVLRVASADTPSSFWASDANQQRATAFVARARQELRAMHPSFPPNSRLYFAHAPFDADSASDGADVSPLDRQLSNDLLWLIDPTVRVWYGDSTLHADYAAHFRPRRPGEPRGRDYWFRRDSVGGWVELAPPSAAP